MDHTESSFIPAVAARLRKLLVLGLLCAALVGCAGQAARLERRVAPGRTPAPREILGCLAQNDSAVESFKASGVLTVESPEIPGKRQCKASIVFKRPSSLHIMGRHRTLDFRVLSLRCVGKEFMLEFPRDGQIYFYSNGKQFESVPFAVSPSDIVGEMFFPERWRDLREDDVRVVDYDSVSGEAVVEVCPGNTVRRRMVVVGTPWVVIRNELLDESGGLRALTLSEDYRVVRGIRFPTRISAEFPGETTRMTVVLHEIRLNAPTDDSIFAIDWSLIRDNRAYRP